MYNLLIVDDEEFVRNGLRDTVNWHSLGFDVKGTAENGIKALEFIKANQIHVVLSDVRMPDMNGIEFIKLMKSLYPCIKVVLLSAYDDFGYAQSAIKYGARGYLLKPLEEEELKEIMLKLAEELDHPTLPPQFDNQVSGLSENDSYGFINKAIQYIYRNFDKKLTLEEVAGILYINPAYFSVVFKKVTGQSFIDFITEVKVEKSKELLKKSRYRVKEIALKVGYDDYTYFCKVFKKKEKITPLEFRSRILLGK